MMSGTKADEPPRRAASLEDSASCVERLFFSYMTPLLTLGSQRPLVLGDVTPCSRADRAAPAAGRFAAEYAAECAKHPTPNPKTGE